MRALLRELREQALELPGVVVSLPTSCRRLQLWLTKAAQPAAGAESGRYASTQGGRRGARVG